MLNVDMLFMKMAARCIFHYDKIAQVKILSDLLIKASKIQNFENKYICQFSLHRSETLVRRNIILT